MIKQTYFCSFLLLVIFSACMGPKEKDPILLEAFEIHKESIEIAAKAVEVWEKLPAQDTMRIMFDSILQEWGDNMVEVPGFHHHHDGLGHHHGRAPLKLLPEDMLRVQKEFRDSISSIYGRILNYKEVLR